MQSDVFSIDAIASNDLCNDEGKEMELMILKLLVGEEEHVIQKALEKGNASIVTAALRLHTKANVKNVEEEAAEQLRTILLTRSTSKDPTLTVDVIIVGPIVHAARESLATLLSLIVDPKSGAGPDLIHLVSQTISFLLQIEHPKLANRESNDVASKLKKDTNGTVTSVDDYVLAVSAKVIEFEDPMEIMGTNRLGNKMKDVRVNDVLTVSIGLGKKGISASSSEQLYVGKEHDEEDRWIVTVSSNGKMNKVFFVRSPNAWKNNVDVSVSNVPGKMKLEIVALPLSQHFSCVQKKVLLIDVLEEEIYDGEEEEVNDDFVMVDGRDSNSVGKVVSVSQNDVRLVPEKYTDHNGVTRQRFVVEKKKKEEEDVGDWDDQILTSSGRPSGSGVSKRSAAKAKSKKNKKSNKSNKKKN